MIALGTLLGMAAAVTTVALLHLATGSSFLRVELPWWLIGMVTTGAAMVALLTSALPARRAAAVPVLEATRAERAAEGLRRGRGLGLVSPEWLVARQGGFGGGPRWWHGRPWRTLWSSRWRRPGRRWRGCARPLAAP